MVGQDVIAVGEEWAEAYQEADQSPVTGEDGNIQKGMLKEESLDHFLLLVSPVSVSPPLSPAGVLHHEGSCRQGHHPAGQLVEPGRYRGGEVEVETVEDKDQDYEDESPAGAEVGQGQDEGQHSHTEVRHVEAHGLWREVQNPV